MKAPPPRGADDIQGLLWSGYGSLPEAAFLLCNVRHPPAARSWLHQVRVTTIADLATHQNRAIQVAISANGLRRLGVAPSIIDGFSPEFAAGIAGDEARSRRLGDVGANAPAHWRWGGAGEPDLILLLYAAAGKLERWTSDLVRELEQAGFAVAGVHLTTDMDGREPFGFADGVSQPRIDWAGQREPGRAQDEDYGNLLAAGEFALGYRNEYGLYTERPLRAGSARDDLPLAEDQPGLGDVGRNGTYLVLRELHQDVREFWRFLARSAGQDGAEGLAEAMVGRRRSGKPLLAPGGKPIPGVGPDPADRAQNQFTYADDARGLCCPLGAHVRRANPRTGDLPRGRQGVSSRLSRTIGLIRSDLQADLVASSRFHRMLRRGREFGSWMEPEAAMQPDSADPQSGLHFICLNANISRQFEFVQNAWLSSAKFDGLARESDPLTGDRAPFPPGHATDGFSLPQPNGYARRLQGVPAFVTVRGGGYFFMPGVRALRFLTR
jgi:deferrochelatase/peroxidase EfeB